MSASTTHRVFIYLTLAWAVAVFAATTHEVMGQGRVDSASIAYEEGLEAYLSEDYEAALDAFERASRTGKTSGELLYNIGSTHFRLNNLGKAVLFYERARKLIPTDDLLNHSIRIARRKSLNRFGQIPRPIWSKYWAAAMARLGSGWMYFVGLCFYLTSMVFLGYRIWSRSRNDWLRRGIALSLLAGLTFLALAFKASFDQSSQQAAVVIENRVDLRATPSQVGDETGTVFEGLVIDVVDRSEGWVEIRIPDGSTGWVEESTIEEV
jgi:tetratricopeptide (TPR) repeat protein